MIALYIGPMADMRLAIYRPDRCCPNWTEDGATGALCSLPRGQKWESSSLYDCRHAFRPLSGGEGETVDREAGKGGNTMPGTLPNG